MSKIIQDLQLLLSVHTLSLQDVLEINECVLKTYIQQRELEIRALCDDDNGGDGDAISVEYDSDGDCVDKEGNIYDVNTKQLVGKKNMNEKVMYNIV